MKVAVITPTIGTDYLEKNLESVFNQTYKNLEHIVVCDGPQYAYNVESVTKKFKINPMILPENTGAGGYNGHRIYAAMPYLINADYFIFLDEDNWIDENHVESLVKTVEKNNWAFSLRKIVDKENNYICNDDCESLGLWNSCLSESEYFVDVNCYFLPKKIAIQTAPIWYRRNRHPEEQPEVDRLLIQVLRQNKFKYQTTGEYTVNYRAGNRDTHSVQSDFFVRGNEMMRQKYNGVFPWRKENLVVTRKTIEVGPGITIVS
jgi:glycosyltransferase involved in cell wall biosynthesis